MKYLESQDDSSLKCDVQDLFCSEFKLRTYWTRYVEKQALEFCSA
jgi:hypothetical protein